MVAGLAVWMWVRHPDRRRAAAALGAGALAWVAIAVGVIMPAFALDGDNPHLSRYALGDGPGEILATIFTGRGRPVAVLATPGRAVYLAALLLPLLLLPLAARSWPPPRCRRCSSTCSPAAAWCSPCSTTMRSCSCRSSSPPPCWGSSRLRGRERPERLARAGATRSRRRPAPGRRRARRRPPGAAADLGLAAGRLVGQPAARLHDGRPGPGAAEGGGPDPRGRLVSAVNVAGAHLSSAAGSCSSRTASATRSTSWWRTGSVPPHGPERPTLRPPGYRYAALLLSRSNRWELVFEEEEVRVYRRIARAGLSASPVGQSPPMRSRCRC